MNARREQRPDPSGSGPTVEPPLSLATPAVPAPGQTTSGVGAIDDVTPTPPPVPDVFGSRGVARIPQHTMGHGAQSSSDALSPVLVHSDASAGPVPAWSVSWVDGTGVDVTVNFVPTPDLGARRRWAWNLLADVLASHACGEVSDASSDDDSDPEPDDGTSAAVREPVAIPPAGFDGGAALPLPDPVTPAESALAVA